MVRWARNIVLGSVMMFGLSACGERGPLTWNANLDVNCKPQDILDKISEKVSTKSFWRNQEYDMGTLHKLSENNIKNVTIILEDSRKQQGSYFSRAEQAANGLGLKGKAKREHVKANMDRFRDEVKALEKQLKVQKSGMAWVRKCQGVVQTQLRKLKLQPVPYNPSKRPR